MQGQIGGAGKKKSVKIPNSEKKQNWDRIERRVGSDGVYDTSQLNLRMCIIRIRMRISCNRIQTF